MGNTFGQLRKIDEAVGAYRRAIANSPNYAKAHYGLSLCLLSLGDLRQGFEEYRWRRKLPDFPEKMPAPSCPLWEGESLSGKAILVHCEQGYGDSLQFIRFIRPLSRMAARVTVLAPRSLTGLFRSIPDIEVPFVYADAEYDYHVPLMCLPRLFGTTLDTIPADVPYLSADPAKIDRWAKRLSQYAGKIKIGLVWAGSSREHNPAANAIDRRRSTTLQQFAPLAGMANVQFFSLQKGEPATQALHPPYGMSLVDWTSELHDFEDTAALIANLDLVISVDTSVVHLAGALAKRVWVLSRFDGCWRWLNGREDSPWYPTARVFHQRAPGAWNEVMERVAAELVKLPNASVPARKEVAAPELPEVTSLFAEGFALHQAGQLADAGRIYNQILAIQPDHFDSLHLLGVILHQRGNHAAAVHQIDSALKINPNNSSALNTRGIALKELKRFEEALASYDRALALRPDYAEAFSNRGNVLKELKRFEDALASYDRALAVRPDFAEALANWGNILKELKRFEEALASYDDALAVRPDYVETLLKPGQQPA